MSLSDYHGGQNTNNHLEAMNRVFKKKWLDERHDKRLDSLLRTFITIILPYYRDKYRRSQMLSIAYSEQVCVSGKFDEALNFCYAR